MNTLYNNEEWFRQERRDRTIVVVGIVDIVGVELNLAIVELEVRRLAEIAIGVRIMPFVRPKVTKP